MKVNTSRQNAKSCWFSDNNLSASDMIIIFTYLFMHMNSSILLSRDLTNQVKCLSIDGIQTDRRELSCLL